MMTLAEIQEYCRLLQERVTRENETVFIERRFEAAKDQGRFSLEVLPYRHVRGPRSHAGKATVQTPDGHSRRARFRKIDRAS